jgi:hypothetical protein
LEDSPESSAEQEKASSSANKSRVSGAGGAPPVWDDGSLDYDGISFCSLLYTFARQIVCKFYNNEI